MSTCAYADVRLSTARRVFAAVGVVELCRSTLFVGCACNVLQSHRVLCDDIQEHSQSADLRQGESGPDPGVRIPDYFHNSMGTFTPKDTSVIKIS